MINPDACALSATRAMLIAAGYRVAALPADETARVEITTLQPALVLLDVPTDDRAYAWELIAHLDAACTAARVPLIVCSEDIFFLRKEADHLARYGYQVLAKPFTRDALLQRIAATLAEARGAQGGMLAERTAAG